MSTCADEQPDAGDGRPLCVNSPPCFQGGRGTHFLMGKVGRVAARVGLGGTMADVMQLPRFVEKLRSGGSATIVAYGDSISEVGRTPGWFGGASAADRNWAQQVGAILRSRCEDAKLIVRNFGIGGQNSYEALGRFDWLGPLDPDLVLVELGTNDCGWHPLPPECTYTAFKMLLEAMQYSGVEAVVLGLAGDNPLSSVFQHEDATREVIRGAAQSAGAPYIDLRSAILQATDNGVRWEDYHTGPSDCHPNDRGHRIWAEAIAKALIEAIDSAGSSLS